VKEVCINQEKLRYSSNRLGCCRITTENAQLLNATGARFGSRRFTSPSLGESNVYDANRTKDANEVVPEDTTTTPGLWSMFLSLSFLVLQLH
jgi:hypothetical protein